MSNPNQDPVLAAIDNPSTVPEWHPGHPHHAPPPSQWRREMEAQVWPDETRAVFLAKLDAAQSPEAVAALIESVNRAVEPLFSDEPTGTERTFEGTDDELADAIAHAETPEELRSLMAQGGMTATSDASQPQEWLTQAQADDLGREVALGRAKARAAELQAQADDLADEAKRIVEAV